MARDLACGLGMGPDYFYNYEYVVAENPEDWFKNTFTSGDHNRLFNRRKDDSQGQNVDDSQFMPSYDEQIETREALE